jgi:hypothetical protein
LGQVDFCQGWYSSLGSCDYYNQCKPDFGVGVPDNLLGSQFAFEGNGYCGFVTYDSNATDYREILSSELSNILEVGHTYYFSVRICRAGEGSESGIASNHIGVKFTTDSATPIIDNSSLFENSNVLLDTISWSILSGSFIATEPYKYIHFANFFEDANTTVIEDGNGDPTWAYYYIDDARLSENPNDMHVAINPIQMQESPNAIVITGGGPIHLFPGFYNARLYNSCGVLCRSWYHHESDYLLFEQLCPGLYFLKIFDTDEQIRTVLILIE